MAPWAPSSPMGGFAQKPHDFSRGGVFTNEGTGDYHGFLINDPRQYPAPIDKLEAAPRVEIPSV